MWADIFVGRIFKSIRFLFVEISKFIFRNEEYFLSGSIG